MTHVHARHAPVVSHELERRVQRDARGLEGLLESMGPRADVLTDIFARHTALAPREIAQHAMTIASEICIYTNANLTIEEL